MDRLVVDIGGVDLLDDLDELIVVEATGGMLNHSLDGVVLLVVVVVEVYNLFPEHVLLAGSQQLGDVEFLE